MGEQAVIIAKEINLFFDTIEKLLKDSVQQLKAIFDEISPKVKQSIQKITKVLDDLQEQYLKLLVQVSNLVLDKIKAHEADIKEIVNSGIQFLQGNSFSALYRVNVFK